MRYLTSGQIMQKFNSMTNSDKIMTLVTAFEIKDISPAYDKETCIACAMGYTLSISGSGYFESNEEL